MLLRAWPRLRGSGLRLRVLGADPLAVRLLLARLRLSEEGIDVLGYVDDETLTQELAAAKLLVAPSLGNESFGMTITRAFACATPVVASDIPGYREVVTAGDRSPRPARRRRRARRHDRRRCSRTSPRGSSEAAPRASAR